jgi:hypothetical protein
MSVQLAGWAEQHRGGRLLVQVIEFADAFMKVRDNDQVGTWRMSQDVVHAIGGLVPGLNDLIEEPVQLVVCDHQRARKPGAHPRLRFSFAPFPSNDCRPLHIQVLSEFLLGIARGLSAPDKCPFRGGV